MSDVSEHVRSLAEPILVRHGADLIDVEFKEGRTTLVRIIADADQGLDLDTCAKVSSELSRMLDASDPIPGRYTLEVTSPGLDRPLQTPQDFLRNVGRRVEVTLDGQTLEGEIGSVTDDLLHLEGVEEPVRLDRITKATLILPW